MKLFLILGTFLALIAYFSPGHLPGQSEYCEMQEVRKNTGGEYGWPAYKGEEVCDD